MTNLPLLRSQPNSAEILGEYPAKGRVTAIQHRKRRGDEFGVSVLTWSEAFSIWGQEGSRKRLPRRR
jgi:hypothetical protein